jgi:20S proteasome alpha/beta subunit
MTIIAGFRCTDGVVLCADRLITRGDSTYYEEKIHLESSHDYALLVAGADDPELAKEIFQLLDKRIAGEPSPTPDSVRASADAILTDMGRLDPTVTSPLPIELLIATSFPGSNAELFAFCGKGLFAVDDYKFGGVGDSSLVRFLCEGLYDERMTTDSAATLGIYLVKKAKDYVRGCGGPTDLFIIRQNGEWQKVEIATIDMVEKELERSEARTLPSLLTFLDLPIHGPITEL